MSACLYDGFLRGSNMFTFRIGNLQSREDTEDRKQDG